MATATTNNQASILERAIDADAGPLPPDVARFFLHIHLCSEDRMRLTELASKAGEGSLSADEEFEIEEYRRAGRILEILRLKARLALNGR